MRPFPVTPETPPSRPSGAAEWFTAVAAAVAAFAAAVNGPVWLRLLTLAFAVLVIVVAWHAPIMKQIRRWRIRRHDEAVVRRWFGPLTRLAEEFKPLVSSSNGGTIQKLLQGALQQDIQTLTALGLPSAHWFDVRLGHILGRLAAGPADMDYFERSFQEFSTLVYEYSEICLRPVFTTHAYTLRAVLTPEGRGALGSFRERYIVFLDHFDVLVKDLTRSLSTPHPTWGVYAFRPDPLSS